ncbi:DUF4331 domain-containing protein [Blastococcus brunescens]|uniref:DUF4331 domain-containing protein n=1 Tax=Blastococcus brunescens TaxID=1564165 RepID=A0ABZ1AZR3_9ACTN|nr:DUF4331 domain-containing protein [Blastococcus sp. BMG 8361]WRL64050.1 DUF4331 domain-containing protein [Blastococcus sp. BMG 8361]
MGTSQEYVDNLRTPAETEVDGGGMTLTTQTEDPFFLDIRVFDLLYGADLSERGTDTLAGYNANSIVLEVPKDQVAIGGNAGENPVIGVWSTTTRPTLRDADGTAADANPGFTQVSRLGQPLVNEVVVPAGLKDAFNSISPDQDAAAADGAVVARVLDPEVPRLIEAIYGIPAPATPRYDIFEVFLTGVVTNGVVDVDGDPATPNPIDVDLNSQALNAAADPAAFQPSEMLRLNMAITGPTGLDMQPLHEASRLGVVGGDIQGFPNGRRLADDVVDIEILALEGIYNVDNIPADRQAAFDALKEGDKVNSNDNAFSASFPYIAGPNTQAVNKGGGTGAGGTDTAAGNGTPGKPVAPAEQPAAKPAEQPAAKPAAQAGQPVANRYPRGGVETGAGGVEDTLIPALTGSAALLLIGAGAGSLIRGGRCAERRIPPRRADALDGCGVRRAAAPHSHAPGRTSPTAREQATGGLCCPARTPITPRPSPVTVRVSGRCSNPRCGTVSSRAPPVGAAASRCGCFRPWGPSRPDCSWATSSSAAPRRRLRRLPSRRSPPRSLPVRPRCRTRSPRWPGPSPSSSTSRPSR